MGRLSQHQIEEIDALCRKINSPDVSTVEKEKAYRKLEEIYSQYFVELPTTSKIQGSSSVS
ncbi:MAG: hypothetical protein K0R78_1048 [Pelosinus sp.]|jgi:hypothetical protein|nr:hypothetical protein [Pelosinus sp.]